MNWPERILGPRPTLRAASLIAWGMFGAFLVLPILVILWLRFTTGSGSIRQFDSDFVYFYGVGHIANTYPAVNLYDFDLQQKTFNAIYPAHDAFYGLSPYPPFVALFFRPFALLSFESAYIIWAVLSLALYIVGIAATVREVFPGDRARASLIFCFALAFYPFIFGTLLNGQLAALAVFSVGLAIFQERHSRPFLSGLALSILTYKPTLLIFVLPLLLLTRRFRALAGFIAGASFLIALTTAFDGLSVWPAYLDVLRRFGKSSLQLWKYVDFNSMSYAVSGGRSRVGLAVLIGASGMIATALAILLWKSARSGRHTQYLAWAACLTWTLLVNVYVPIYDSVLVTISIVLTLGALPDSGWITLLSLLIFATSWTAGIHLFSILLAVLGFVQISVLYRSLARPS